jgi:DNA polymerase-3 subunit epsilon
MLAYGEYRGIWNDYFGNWKWHKLSDAAARVGYKLPAGMKAHGALADCLMTLAVCKKIAGL